MMERKKLLYIHGWNFSNYTSLGDTGAWLDKSKLIEKLSENFGVTWVKLPGFFGQPDPDKPWGVDDYVRYVDQIIQKEKPDYVVGYSFGGAVLVRWRKLNPDISVRVVLVSPAILRQYEYKNQNIFWKILKNILPKKIASIVRDIYLVKVVDNLYYVKASPVMRKTYTNIVKVDLRPDLLDISKPLTIIYGEKDTATPPNLMKETIAKSTVQHNFYIIPDGGHDIGRTHTDEVVNLILK